MEKMTGMWYLRNYTLQTLAQIRYTDVLSNVGNIGIAT